MQSFNKNHEPKELITFKETIQKAKFPPQGTFEALKNDEVALIPTQLSLADELGYVCVYCQSPLREYTDNHTRKRVKIEIEHYKPKSIFNGSVNSTDKNHLLCDTSQKIREDLRIEYSNLLGACGQSEHCGNAKGDTELCFIPNPKTTRNRDFPIFSYSFKGKIRHDINEDIDKELNEVLNLNCTKLKDKRIGIWNSLRRKIRNECNIKDLHKGGQKEIQFVKDLIKQYKSRKSDGKFYPFYNCAVHLLKREYKEKL